MTMTELQDKYTDLLHEHAMDQEVICLLLEALGGEFTIEDTTDVIECTSDKAFVSTKEGNGIKLTLIHRPKKVGFLVTCGPDPEDIPEAQEATIDIKPLDEDEDA